MVMLKIHFFLLLDFINHIYHLLVQKGFFNPIQKKIFNYLKIKIHPKICLKLLGHRGVN
jgi:hypothetical protein